jgi:hypothetical protein
MKDLRVTVTLDFEVDDGTDEDEFHDALYEALEADEVAEAIAAHFRRTSPAMQTRLDTVREIDVEVLE